MTISEQAKRVELLYPQMALVWSTWWGAYWTGELRGLEGQPPYRVGILFTAFAPDPFELRYPGLRVKAWLIDPPLQNRLVDGLELRPPHIWPQFSDAMCFYKPYDDGLTYDVDIAKTVIPWIIKWLASYEIWLATGTWVGPQAHPSGGREASSTSEWPRLEFGDLRQMAAHIAGRWRTHGGGHLLSSASAGRHHWPWLVESHLSPSALQAGIQASLTPPLGGAQDVLQAA